MVLIEIINLVTKAPKCIKETFILCEQNKCENMNTALFIKYLMS